jgi:hypothetical protein
VAERALGRRTFIKATGALALLAFADPVRLSSALAALPGPGQAGRFLTAHELDALRAVTGRLIPGPPDDPDPGAIEAGCAEAIDLLLAAFSFDPPLIHAGGPFSNRAGATHDDLADFVPLDALAELGWRIRLEGSRGMKEREFAGPVQGLQELYRSGLAHLDERATPFGGGFANVPTATQDVILSDVTDTQVQDFVSMAMSDTIAAMYGLPEYGGNRGLVGWTTTGWPGDVQPRGYTAAQVTESDPAPATPLSAAEARAALDRLFAGMGGERADRLRWWRARPGYRHG